MKYLSLLMLALALFATPLRADQVSVAVDPNATNEAIRLREVLNNADANFTDLYRISTDLYRGASTAHTVTYGATTTLDFALNSKKILVLTGGVTLATTNLVAGKEVTVQITGGASSRTLAFPAGWAFVSGAAPTALAANKTALLVLNSFGTTDAAIVARYFVQP